jgi:uncharacterized protein YndB with AHSA1/START domain
MDLHVLLATTGNMSQTNLQQQITVHALPSKVWKVLTNSEYVSQYFFKDTVHCDWTEGSVIRSRNGNETQVTIGKVLESVPGMLLKFNFLDETDESYLTRTYELILAGDGVELKMKCEGFTATNPEFRIRLQQASLVLQKIKWLSEYS